MKKIFFILFIIFSLTNSSYAAGSSSNTKTNTSNYDKAVKLIKFAKKYEQKGKIDKANKRYEKALKLLVKSVGNDKIMFGTDHPFFPPINNNDTNWKSTTKIQNIITNLENKTSNKIFFENAKNLFNL